MNIFPEPPVVAIKALLSTCDLPIEDLGDQRFEHFFGCGPVDSPAGVVGLELHGRCALLRSLAVDPSVRGQGCGKALVQRLEEHAQGLGVASLYLLTTTAQAFFESLGYSVVERSTAPLDIQATREFTSLCPGSASFMVKHLEL